MADDAPDPYTFVLKLLPGPRPPNHYVLLDLELFCSHHERINQACRKQFRLVKPYQDHPDHNIRRAIQTIMNAIASARVVLTDPRRKEEYDLDLAQTLDINRDAHLAAHVAAPLPEFEIVVTAGPTLVAQSFELVEGTALTIGSDARCSIPLNLGRTSPRHGKIEFDQGRWNVARTDPDRAVSVNDTVCEEHILDDGDRIDLGDYRLLFRRIRHRDTGGTQRQDAPPLSLIMLKGPSIVTPSLSVIAPERIVIGHDETVLWQIPDRTVSHRHCAVQSVGDRWELEDLDSTNGTRVNGVEVLRHVLSDRDVISIGRFEVLASLRI